MAETKIYHTSLIHILISLHVAILQSRGKQRIWDFTDFKSRADFLGFWDFLGFFGIFRDFEIFSDFLRF
jgi:hypothetical protein